MNEKLLREVKAQTLKEPGQFIMDFFFADQGRVDLAAERGVEIRRILPSCKTAACIAGWTISIGRGTSPSVARMMASPYEDAAQNLLGITRYQGKMLFYVQHWPGDLRDKWCLARTLEGRAQVASERIDRFIKSGGME